jgi:hypothetical protein
MATILVLLLDSLKLVATLLSLCLCRPLSLVFTSRAPGLSTFARIHMRFDHENCFVEGCRHRVSDWHKIDVHLELICVRFIVIVS